VAVEWQSKAIQLAHSSEQEEMREELERYRSGKPWRFSLEKEDDDVAPPAIEGKKPKSAAAPAPAVPLERTD
jgi:hypothetical protein